MPLLRDYTAEHERAVNLGGDAVRALDALLRSMDLSTPADQDRFRTEIFNLHEHIAKEEDALFPASVTTLDGDQWDAAMAAWQHAHPGEHMLNR
ncbi:hypothetical protein AAFP30_00055 [Gordonia sp. CPCC 205515]|uniref:hypothetical protein n=1 Tax=Gordonia sp. CPCC 205515 TaxID=3140791 RepID=UPI003AF359DA